MPIGAPRISSTMRLVDLDGDELYSVDSFTSTRLTNLDLGYPTIRTVTTPTSGAHGQTDTTKWFGDRAITAELTMPERPYTDTAVDSISGLMDPFQRLWLYAQRPDWTTERRILVRPATFVCPAGILRKAQAGWVGPAGLLEDSVVASVTLSPSASNPSGGIQVPLTVPMVFSGGQAPGAALLNVAGNTSTPPVIDIYGPCADPLIRCVTTGQQVSFAGFSIAAGDYLHVDMAARTVTLNGDVAQSRYNRRDPVTSTWWTLPKGSVQVLFSAAGASSPCQAVMYWRPRFI